jgi:hypothetical protein
VQVMAQNSTTPFVSGIVEMDEGTNAACEKNKKKTRM